MQRSVRAPRQPKLLLRRKRQASCWLAHSRRREDWRSAEHWLCTSHGGGLMFGCWHLALAGCVFFISVNQVLVRLWARHLGHRPTFRRCSYLHIARCAGRLRSLTGKRFLLGNWLPSNRWQLCSEASREVCRCDAGGSAHVYAERRACCVLEDLPAGFCGVDGSCAWWVGHSLWRLSGVIERKKGIRWMPWHQEAMKDVARCEKPWGAASRR